MVSQFRYITSRCSLRMEITSWTTYLTRGEKKKGSESHALKPPSPFRLFYRTRTHIERLLIDNRPVNLYPLIVSQEDFQSFLDPIHLIPQSSKSAHLELVKIMAWRTGSLAALESSRRSLRMTRGIVLGSVLLCALQASRRPLWVKIRPSQLK